MLRTALAANLTKSGFVPVKVPSSLKATVVGDAESVSLLSVGAPHPTQAGALSDTCRPHSAQVINAIFLSPSAAIYLCRCPAIAPRQHCAHAASSQRSAGTTEIKI